MFKPGDRVRAYQPAGGSMTGEIIEAGVEPGFVVVMLDWARKNGHANDPSFFSVYAVDDVMLLMEEEYDGDKKGMAP